MEAPAPPPPKPPRRPRYAGTHPRRFAEKYKEQDPSRYPDTVAKVLASGKTPAGSHVPVLVEEVLAALDPQPGGVGVDCTLGHGGHALRILPMIVPGGRLIGLDVDPVELPRTEERIREAGFGTGDFVAVRSNFAGLPKVLGKLGLEAADFILADLGCSSMQLDDPARGFTFKSSGPLDMRLNPQRGLSARDWLARAKPADLGEVLRENADEPQAESLAAALAGRDFPDTRSLAEAVRAVVGTETEESDLAVRRVFQAVRIAVNDEFGSLEAFLRALPSCLAPGGRVAVISFHSGEDRRVKKSFQAGLRDGLWSEVSDGPVTAGPEERHSNPRSVPAKLRLAVRAAF